MLEWVVGQSGGGRGVRMVVGQSGGGWGVRMGSRPEWGWVGC